MLLTRFAFQLQEICIVLGLKRLYFGHCLELCTVTEILPEERVCPSKLFRKFTIKLSEGDQLM